MTFVTVNHLPLSFSGIMTRSRSQSNFSVYGNTIYYLTVTRSRDCPRKRPHFPFEISRTSRVLKNSFEILFLCQILMFVVLFLFFNSVFYFYSLTLSGFDCKMPKPSKCEFFLSKKGGGKTLILGPDVLSYLS